MTGMQHTIRGLIVGASVCVLASCGGQVATESAAEPSPEVSVTIAPIVRSTLHAYVAAWGTVEPQPAMDGVPAASARVASPVSGLIADVLVGEGQRVARGATVFRLDSRVVDVTVERATQAVHFAQQLVQRQERLGPGQATSQKAYEDAQAQLAAAQNELNTAELQRRLLEVNAPIDGTVVKLSARQGDAIDPSTVLAELVDMNRLVVAIAVRSLDVAQVKRGQAVELGPAAAPDVPKANTAVPAVASTIEYIAHQVTTANDSVIVLARVPSASGLRHGQFVSAQITTDEHRDRLAVPVDSVLQGDQGSEVALVQGDQAVRTRVTTGLRDHGLVEVEGDGIREGASVVVQGAYGLPARARIKVTGR